jgi:hypothetical protein
MVKDKVKMNLQEDDFGFSLVTEEELKANEEALKKKVEEQSLIVQQTSAELNDKLHGLRNMIMPLLKNLSKDSEKEYIWWPNRVEKITQFINKINDYVDN